eukprot:3774856-Alexandrium_andersonii.AAC.2
MQRPRAGHTPRGRSGLPASPRRIRRSAFRCRSGSVIPSGSSQSSSPGCPARMSRCPTGGALDAT